MTVHRHSTWEQGLSTLDGWGLNAFTPDDLDSIHAATLKVLEDVGIRIEDSQEALEILSTGGARVERRGRDAIVKFPASVVEDCIGWASQDVLLRGKNPQYDYALEPHRVTFATMGELIQIIDLETGTLRPTTQQDSADIARLCDSLDEVGVMHRPVASLDKPPGTHPVFNAQSLFANTGKHVLIGPVNARNLQIIAQMAFAHAGGAESFARRPIFTAIVAPTSPLTLVQDCVEMIVASARLAGGGILCAPAIVGGATGPVTLAGALVCINAEVLAGLVLAQLVRRGTRVIYGNSGAMIDLRTANHAYGAPEMGMLNAATARLAQYYGLPSLVSAFPGSSKAIDPQIGYESATNALVAALAGANIVNGLGTLEFGLTFDYAKFMLDVECARMIQAVVAGMPLTEAYMALSVIAEVGPGGEFLTHDHTLRHMRERSQSRLFDRRSREAWRHLETPDIVERAYGSARQILATHAPPPVSPETRLRVQEIIDAYLAGPAAVEPGDRQHRKSGHARPQRRATAQH
jgi:trimethylamine--corrinoid protein Co-methyltransferase